MFSGCEDQQTFSSFLGGFGAWVSIRISFRSIRHEHDSPTLSTLVPSNALSVSNGSFCRDTTVAPFSQAPFLREQTKEARFALLASSVTEISRPRPLVPSSLSFALTKARVLEIRVSKRIRAVGASFLFLRGLLSPIPSGFTIHRFMTRSWLF